MQETEGSAPRRRSFKSLIFPVFNAAAIANELLELEASRLHRQEVLFAGFRAWILAPSNSDARNGAMRHAARKIYDNACDELIKRHGKILSPETAWTKKKIRALKSKIYDPLGGHSALYGTRGSFDLEEYIERYFQDGDLVIRLAQIWHYRTINGADPISIVNTKEPAAALSGTFGRDIERSWEDMKASVAFSYAASRTSFSESQTVLERLRQGEFTFEQTLSVLPQWFARAKYFDMHVLAKLPKAKPKVGPGYLQRRRRFPDLSQLAIDGQVLPAPAFSPDDLIKIDPLSAVLR